MSLRIPHRGTLGIPLSLLQLRQTPRGLRLSYSPHVRRIYAKPATPRHSSSRPSINDGPTSRTRPIRSAIRPLTLLTFCIPAGYLARWFFDENASLLSSGASKDGFLTYTLTSKETISSTLSLFTLTSPATTTSSSPPSETPVSLTSIQIKQPELQIARSYTPLDPQSSSTNESLRLLIRREPRGEVSSWLHSLQPGKELEIRGPRIELQFPAEGEQGVSEILFLAAGTGVAPALQLAAALVDGYQERGDGSGTSLQRPSMSVLWACRRREDCVGGVGEASGHAGRAWWQIWKLASGEQNAPAVKDGSDKGYIVAEWDSLIARYGSINDLRKTQAMESRLSVQYFVDEEKTFIRPRAVANALSSSAKTSGRKLVFVSGPDGFVDYWAGPKEWIGGRETQGPLGGVLAEMDLGEWQVVKF